MRYLLVSAFACTALLIVTASGAEEVPKKKEGFGFYVGGYGGVAIPETFDNVSVAPLTIGDLKMKTGHIFGMKFGFTGHSKDQVWRYFGAEVDLSITNTALKAQPWRVTGGGLNGAIPVSQADVRLFTSALHGVLRLPDGPVQPYIGIGPAIIHGRVAQFNIANIRTDDSSGTSIGLSAIGGVRFKFSEQWGMFLEYKQIRAAMEFDDLKGDAVIHAGVVGVAASF